MLVNWRQKQFPSSRELWNGAQGLQALGAGTRATSQGQGTDPGWVGPEAPTSGAGGPCLPHLAAL